MTTSTENDQVVTVQPVTVTTSPPPPTSPPAEAARPLPGVPLLTAGANAGGLAAAGLLSAGGPVTLAVAGVTAGAVAAGAWASRAARSRTRRRTERTGSIPNPRRAASTGSGRSAPLSGGNRGMGRRGVLSTSAGRPSKSGLRSGSPAGRTPAAPGLSPKGRGGGPSAGPVLSRSGGGKHRATDPVTAPRSGRVGPGSPAGRTNALKTAGGSGRTGGSLLRRAAGRLDTARTNSAARVSDRSAKRASRGTAKAVRDAGGATAKAQSRALRRSALRHCARMTGAVAGTAAVGLWNWKKRGVIGRMRRTWGRLAGRARQVRAARDAALTGQNGPAGQVPVPADTVNDPRRAARSAAPRVAALVGRAARRLTLGSPQHPTRTGGSMSNQLNPTFTRLSDSADLMHQAASTFDPEEMEQFQALIDDLPEAMVRVQETLRILAELAQERLPVDPAVVEGMGDGFRAMNRVVEALDEVPVIYRRVHAPDIERKENPRNGLDGERRWNV